MLISKIEFLLLLVLVEVLVVLVLTRARKTKSKGLTSSEYNLIHWVMWYWRKWWWWWRRFFDDEVAVVYWKGDFIVFPPHFVSMQCHLKREHLQMKNTKYSPKLTNNSILTITFILFHFRFQKLFVQMQMVGRWPAPPAPCWWRPPATPPHRSPWPPPPPPSPPPSPTSRPPPARPLPTSPSCQSKALWFHRTTFLISAGLSLIVFISSPELIVHIANNYIQSIF